MKRLRGRLTYANVVSTLCLFLLLGGISYAATQLPRNSVGPKQLKRNAVSTPKIKNGAITKAKIQGATLAILRGAAGPPGPVGPAGPAGPAGGIVPTGVTLRGSLALGVGDGQTIPNEFISTGVSFGGYMLPERPVINLVPPPFTNLPARPACPGTPSAPEAAPGNLCVYLATFSPNIGGNITVADPTSAGAVGVKYNVDSKVTTLLGDGRAARVGFIVSHSVPATLSITASGTWAVTG